MRRAAAPLACCAGSVVEQGLHRRECMSERSSQSLSATVPPRVAAAGRLTYPALNLLLAGYLYMRGSRWFATAGAVA